MAPSPGPDDPVWAVPWLVDLLDVPPEGRWPRFMTAPHPLAVASYGAEFEAWHAVELGPLRWVQRLVARRLLEHDANGRLVWLELLLTMARQVGKSTLLRGLTLWRLAQRDRFGEPQLVVHTGKDVASCVEVWSPAASWAQDEARVEAGWRVRSANDMRTITAPDGESRWLILSKTQGGFSFSTSVVLVDEAWRVRLELVEEGLEPTMAEREQSQILIVSTASSAPSATRLFPRRRAAALRRLAAGTDVLLIEWSVPAGSDYLDPETWRRAAPHWTEWRERRIRLAAQRAADGMIDAETEETDPWASFASQWLNIWPEQSAMVSSSPLVDADLWRALGDISEPPPPGPLVLAVEDWYGLGASVAAAGVAYDGRVMVWGRIMSSRSAAMAWLERLAAEHPGSTLRVGLALAAEVREQSGLPHVCELEPATSTAGRAALAALRALVAEGRIVHDGGSDLTDQVASVIVSEGATGLSVARQSPRSDLLRAAAGAAHRASTPARPAEPFRVL